MVICVKSSLKCLAVSPQLSGTFGLHSVWTHTLKSSKVEYKYAINSTNLQLWHFSYTEKKPNDRLQMMHLILFGFLHLFTSQTCLKFTTIYEQSSSFWLFKDSNIRCFLKLLFIAFFCDLENVFEQSKGEWWKTNGMLCVGIWFKRPWAAGLAGTPFMLVDDCVLSTVLKSTRSMLTECEKHKTRTPKHSRAKDL